jgi:hypothetical protein
MVAGTTDFPDSPSHSRIAFRPPEARSLPSAENAGRTVAGPVAVRTSFPARGSNQRTPSEVPIRRVLPSGANRAQ